jgi:hypothetical protein
MNHACPLPPVKPRASLSLAKDGSALRAVR